MVGHANILLGAWLVMLTYCRVLPARSWTPPRPGKAAQSRVTWQPVAGQTVTVVMQRGQYYSIGVGVEKCWAMFWLGGILGCGVTARARNEDCPKVPKDFSTMALLNGH